MIYDVFKTEIEDLCKSFPKKDFLIIGTKLDLLETERTASLENNFDLLISNETKINIEELKNNIFAKANPELKSVADASHVSINTRQADLLRQCNEALKKSLESAEFNMEHDFWTIDLKLR